MEKELLIAEYEAFLHKTKSFDVKKGVGGLYAKWHNHIHPDTFCYDETVSWYAYENAGHITIQYALLKNNWHVVERIESNQDDFETLLKRWQIKNKHI